MINYDDEDAFLINRTKSRRPVCKARLLLLVFMILLFGVGFIGGFFLERTLAKNQTSSHSKENDDNQKFHKIVIDEMAASQIKENLKELTSVQHIAGSEDDVKQTKEFIFKKWVDFLGKEKVKLDKYNVLLSYPMEPGKVSIMDERSGDVLFTSKGNESRLWKDEYIRNVAVPFNAYSAAKSVKGKLVYVNYATAKDFELLRSLNIDCTGKILIARYGKNFRANKVALGEAAGAIGMILYTDNANYASGKTTYPDSWWMPPDGVQRGTVILTDGDPLTPGYPSTEHTFRIHENQTSLPKIPVQPISYQDALPLIRLLDGTEIPKNWKDWTGGLNATYRITMSENNTRYVHVNVSTKTERRDIYNVVATVRGSVEPDRIIIVGNHHDAWVMGAVDPSSGTAGLMEIVRTVGIAVKNGWKPRRTLMFCNWDAEEYGLVGSTEWLEDYSSMIQNNVVAYLNTDLMVNGNYSIDVRGSEQLANMVFETAKQVKDPNDESKSIYENWKRAFPDKDQPFYPRFRAPGAGSDHKHFYMQYGVPVVDVSYTYNWDDYNHAMSYPVYHSIHDSFHWMSAFVDPNFTHHLAVSRIWAKMAMTLVDQELLPFNFSRLGWKLSQCESYFLKKHGDALSQHGIKLDYLTENIKKFKTAVSSFTAVVGSLDRNNDLQVRMVNDKMMQVERGFLTKTGLPGRPFTKNVVFAPAQHDQYSGACFPGINDAMYDVIQKNKSDWSSVEQQISILSFHILQAARVLTK